MRHYRARHRHMKIEEKFNPPFLEEPKDVAVNKRAEFESVQALSGAGSNAILV